ncbi:KAP P-loop [Cordyceps fumosorosea ARSEF 2679]|uniref:KAP P-loop n=1 Tax=Cordyceps fumosorosea (strain ARSEF 2679) TaxID=1081104 RepID=A0A167JGW5_CORFA|nr:KAP P-loop [Cordyceps fumosorosea ARSEF 2679]OAA50247.1 KAP P-loop [Cordyceps fumosorosea ARSEF 2679]
MAPTTQSHTSTGTVATEKGSGSVIDRKPMVIGLYGLPGSGKSSLVNQMKLHVNHENFLFYEGSELISTIMTEGVAAFAKLNEKEKRQVREQAINSVEKDCLTHNRTALVVGHYMFWPKDEMEGNVVATASDFRVYTHIIYLDVTVPAMRERRLRDTHRQRRPVSAAHLEQWQQAEIDQLRRLCDPLSFTLKLVRHFERTNGSCNLALVATKVKTALVADERTETVLSMALVKKC